MLAVKGQVIGSRRVIVKNPDGTTRIIQQATTQLARSSASAASSATSPSPSTNASQGNATSTTPASTPHKVQIIRGPDGKVSVRGLNPGQQLVQMPDGKLHVLTTTTSNAVTSSECIKQLLFIFIVVYINSIHAFRCQG